MQDTLALATGDGIVLGTLVSDSWTMSRRSLAGHTATSIIAREGVILIGTTDGVFRSDDKGETWNEASSGMSVRHVRWLVFHPDISDLEFAGTEPAAIFVSQNGARSWRER